MIALFLFRQPENVVKPRGQQVAHPTKVQQRRRVGFPAHRNGRIQYNGRMYCFRQPETKNSVIARFFRKKKSWQSNLSR